MKITREELQAIENHISNIPHVGGMYAPALIAWCRALLDEQDAAYRRGAEAMREACAKVDPYHAHRSNAAFARSVDSPASVVRIMQEAIRALPMPEEP